MNCGLLKVQMSLKAIEYLIMDLIFYLWFVFYSFSQLISRSWIISIIIMWSPVRHQNRGGEPLLLQKLFCVQVFYFVCSLMLQNEILI